VQVRGYTSIPPAFFFRTGTLLSFRVEVPLARARSLAMQSLVELIQHLDRNAYIKTGLMLLVVVPVVATVVNIISQVRSIS